MQSNNYFGFLHGLINLIYADTCNICGKYIKQLIVCKDCENNFILRKDNYKKKFENITVYSWAYYEGVVRQGVLNLKSGKQILAAYFAHKLADFWQTILNDLEENDRDFIVVNVPSHKKRIKDRGYCQSSLIASKLAQKTGLNYAGNFITRTKETSFMNSLSNINERKDNIKGAFDVIDVDEVKSRSLLIIDDILTSGSTLCELAKTIIQKHPDAKLLGLTVASGDTYN